MVGRVNNMQYRDEIVNEIVNELLNGTFSIFCGSGATYDATGQQWQDIFTETTQSFYNTYSSDIYFLADLEKRYHNKENFEKDICNKILLSSNLESEHINNIVNLNINQIWTTNFDQVIENTIHRKFNFFPTIIKKSADLFTENLNSRYTVYKLNGCVSETDTMILTKSDFYNYFKNQRLLFEVLKRQLILDTFLFVGYSFTDDLVLNALREIKEVFPNRGKLHYRFVKLSKEKMKWEYDSLEENYYLDEYNIKTIPIEDYTNIDTYLKMFYERFCNYNVLISGSFRQLKNNDERVYIENLIDSIIQRLIENNFNIYSGNGRGLGEIVIAQINKNNAEKHFVNRPLIFTNDTIEQKVNKNRLIIKDCDTMIIICGQDETLKSSKNVMKQFSDFIQNNEKNNFHLIIPIPSTGYAAKEIFNSEIFRKSNSYLLNKEIFDNLSEITNINEITEIIINLIKSYKSTNS